MADDSKTSGTGPFDLDAIRQLVRLMKRFDLSEVDLSEGDQRIRLRRGARLVAAAPLAAPVPMAAPASYPQPAAGGPTAAPAPAADTKKYLEIKSPMVGTYYAKPAPDKDDYVKVGSKVTKDTVVCKVEAMKIFNDLTAGLNGTIVEVLVQNGGAVEYDQVLFRVDPS
ncbi:acetyl-CoA carboxylase biotin carboxyl carrier protein [Telmatocola sphagniphila]|nr:acetyl-CoA carboxylase biotin carboxyl carrier protein [Telmatocola sphagniphila]